MSIALVALIAFAAQAGAQVSGRPPEAGEKTSRAPDVAFEQKVGGQVPMDTPFRGEDGIRTTLRDCAGGKPFVLVMAYLHCPHMCGEVQNGVLNAVRAMPDYHVGRDFQVIVVSFDPKDSHLMAAAQRDFYVKQYGRLGAEKGWRFLTGERRSIEELINAIGFKFEFDKAAKEYSHDAAIMVVTPDGKLSKYFFGVQYIDKDEEGRPKDPATANDLKKAIVDAGGGKIAGPVEQFLTLCSRLLHMDGSHPTLMTVVRVAGILTVLSLCGYVVYMVRRERRKDAAATAATAAPTEQSAGGA